MNILLKEVNRNNPEYKQIRHLYKAAFPLSERAPFFMLARKAKQRNVDWWGIFDDKTWIGFFYVLNGPDLTYVFYFAVSEKERGKGYGSHALAALKEKYKGNRIFLAIEEVVETAPNYMERVKRRQFYQKNGFEDLHAGLREGTVIYELLGIGGTVSKQEYKQLISRWLGTCLSKLVKMELIS